MAGKTIEEIQGMIAKLKGIKKNEEVINAELQTIRAEIDACKAPRGLTLDGVKRALHERLSVIEKELKQEMKELKLELKAAEVYQLLEGKVGSQIAGSIQVLSKKVRELVRDIEGSTNYHELKPSSEDIRYGSKAIDSDLQNKGKKLDSDQLTGYSKQELKEEQIKGIAAGDLHKKIKVRDLHDNLENAANVLCNRNSSFDDVLLALQRVTYVFKTACEELIKNPMFNFFSPVDPKGIDHILKNHRDRNLLIEITQIAQALKAKQAENPAPPSPF